MIFGIFFVVFGYAETIDIYSSYSSNYEQLCTNYYLQAKGLLYESGEEVQPFRISTPGVYELKTNDGSSYLFKIIECNSFNWGMSTSNTNRFVLSKNDTLRIWVDDASSFDRSSDNLPNEVSKQLTSMINSMGVHPTATISDAMTHEICQTITNFIFNPNDMWWEAKINCSVDFFYNIQFQDLVGFSSPTGQQPNSNTNVYPPIPSIVPTIQSIDEDPPLLGTYHCPCIPSLNAVVHNSKIYVSSTNYHNYSIIENINNAIFVDFIDNSLIYIDEERGLTIQNFANESQKYTVNGIKLNKISSPNFCSFSSTLKRDQSSSIIAWDTNNPNHYVFINLTYNPTHFVHSLDDEEIVSITSTLSSKSDFYLILRNKSTHKLILKKLNISNKFTERIDLDIPDESNVSLYWSPFGYIFLIYENNVQCSSESQILFSDLQFSNDSERENVTFHKILENSKGEFLVTTKDGSIFFMTIDAPILSKIQTRFKPDEDDIAVNTDGDMFIILTSDGENLPIPIESEMSILKMKSQFWSNIVCPNSVEIKENIPEGNLLVDKSDRLFFSGSIFSQNSQKFVIHVSDYFFVNITSNTEKVIQLQPQTNHFLPLQKHTFNLTLTPKKIGIGSFVIHTTSPSWICGNNMITRNFVIGCTSHKELRIRGGPKINQFYTNTYVRPIVDVYIFDQFVEEFKGNLTVFSNKKIGFVDKYNNVLNGTNENKIILYKLDQEYEITLISDESWSYCNFSVTAYVTIVSPDFPYYYYSVIGVGLYCILMLIYATVVLIQWKKRKKEKAE